MTTLDKVALDAPVAYSARRVLAVWSALSIGGWGILVGLASLVAAAL